MDLVIFVFSWHIINTLYVDGLQLQLYITLDSNNDKKQGLKGPQKSLKIQKTPLKIKGVCHETIKNGFLLKKQRRNS